jgi:glycosyltransferase involved in cell wall biosynthesis
MPDTQSRKGQYQLKTLGKIMSTALANFSPEYNRANIYRALLGLKDTPYVLPNKPAFLPTKDSLMEMGIRYKDIVNKINGRRVILYQGLLGKERNIGSFIKVIRKLDKGKYVTVLLGKKTPMLDIYKYHDPNLIHIDYLPAPDYLFITSLAYLGIVSYLPDKLNTIFCAPNKIFEYSAFGIPMLGNNIPGLKYTIEESGCGLVCDDSSEEDIFEKLNVILNNYQKYSENAIRFFNSVDNKETIRKALLKIENKGFDR